jgi:hypothetical protein
VAGADLRRNSYSVRYSHLARPQHSVRVSLVSARRIRRRSGLLGARVDRFDVRAEPLPGNAGECGVWNVCSVAHVWSCPGSLVDSLADMNRCASLHGCNRSHLGACVRRTRVGFRPGISRQLRGAASLVAT